MLKSDAIDVLIVDDSDSDAELAMKALSPLHCFRTSDGEQCIDFIRCTGMYRERREVLPRLVLLDLDLPGLSGFDVIEVLRAHYSAADLPIVVFTSSTNEYIEQRCVELGADAYVVKPADYNGYSSRLKEVAAAWMRANPPAR